VTVKKEDESETRQKFIKIEECDVTEYSPSDRHRNGDAEELQTSNLGCSYFEDSIVKEEDEAEARNKDVKLEECDITEFSLPDDQCNLSLDEGKVTGAFPPKADFSDLVFHEGVVDLAACGWLVGDSGLQSTPRPRGRTRKTNIPRSDSRPVDRSNGFQVRNSGQKSSPRSCGRPRKNNLGLAPIAASLLRADPIDNEDPSSPRKNRDSDCKGRNGGYTSARRPPRKTTLRSTSVGVISDGQFSDDPNDACRMVCNICGEETKALRSHVRKRHDISITELRSKFPEMRFSKRTYHRYFFKFNLR
jgi:hypothetical protein